MIIFSHIISSIPQGGKFYLPELLAMGQHLLVLPESFISHIIQVEQQ